jgi:GNAT superfamily N-acetyltransferase
MEFSRLKRLLPANYTRALPLFEGFIRDPLMFAVLEGKRPGRVYADHPDQPRAALVWTDTECVYLAADPADRSFFQNFHQFTKQVLFPTGKALDLDFLTLFTHPPELAHILKLELAPLEPLITPANTFSFNRRRYNSRRAELLSVPEGMRILRLDENLLFSPENDGLLDAVLHYWGSVEAFLQYSLGYAMLHEEQVVSWLYVQAQGAEGQAPDTWTDPDYRGLGLASRLVARWVEDCLRMGLRPFWINDRVNRPSRRLAEQTGFDYQGDIELLDIPFYPFEFYRGMARHFFLVNDSYDEAASSFEHAFRLGEADPSDYYLAAAAWMHAGEPQRALQNLQRAVDHGLEDLLALEGTEAFDELRLLPEWDRLKQYYFRSRRSN